MMQIRLSPRLYKYFIFTALLSLGAAPVHGAESPNSIFSQLGNANIRVLTPDECWDFKPSDQPEITGTPLGNSASPYSKSEAKNAVVDKANETESQTINKNDKDKNKSAMAEPLHELPFNLFRYHPDGSSPRFRSPQCSPERISQLMTESTDIGAQSKKVSAFFQTCENELAFFGHSDWQALLESVSSDYDVCDNSNIRELMLHLPDGNKVRALLAVKPPDASGYYRSRPLVIVKAGVFGNAGDSSTRTMLMHYFDEAPFNVLVLGNDTGTQYVVDNQHVALGGFDEGMQIIEIAKIFKASAFGPSISTMHVIGISLGGQAALFSSYFNSFNDEAKHRPYIRSVMALCPVVNLEPSVEHLFSGEIKGRLVRDLFLSDFYEVLTGIPVLGSLLTELKGSVAEKIPDVVAKGAINYYQDTKKTWGIAPFEGTQIKNMLQLWQDNDFLREASYKLETPTMVFGAKVDWVVDPKPNSMALQAALQEPSAAGSQLKAVIVDRGNHCAFEASYGYDVFSSFLKSYMLSRSPDMLQSRHELSAKFPSQLLPKWARPDADRGESYAGVHFKFKANSDKVHITFDIVDGDHVGDQACDGEGYQLSDECIRSYTAAIPLESLPSWARLTRTRADADALTRWTNANVRFLTAKNQILNYQSDIPVSLRWTDY